VTALLTSTNGGGRRFACSRINFLYAGHRGRGCGPILLPPLFAWWKIGATAMIPTFHPFHGRINSG
jgi:hypothetical protein